MEVGDHIKDASVFALTNTGQFIDGALQSTYGLVKQNDYHKYEGLQQLKDTSGRTLKGFGNVLIFTAKNSGATVSGVISGDKEQVIVGMKNLGKVVAVSTLAIGIVDLADGSDLVSAEGIETRNDHLNGFEHAETCVPFIVKRR